MEKKMDPGASALTIAGLSLGAWAIVAGVVIVILAMLGII